MGAGYLRGAGVVDVFRDWDEPTFLGWTLIVRRYNDHSMNGRTLNLQLPRGWYEVESKQTRSFRRHGQNCGILHLSLQPPLEMKLADGEQVLAYLKEMLNGLHTPLGSLITSGHEECAEGIMAFATYRNVHDGLHEFWLIPAEATVFVSWQMGSIGTAGLERSEAHEMLRSMHFEDFESDEITPDESNG